MKTKRFRISVFELTDDAERLNNRLDRLVGPEVYPVDVSYRFLSVTERGELEVEATYEEEEM